MRGGGTGGRTSGIVAMTIVTIIYGVSYLSRGIIAAYLNQTVIVAFQLAIMAVLFLAYDLMTRKDMKIQKRDIALLIGSGLLGTAIYNVFTIFSVTEIGPNLSSLLYGFAAVLALGIDVAFRHRRATKLSIAGIVVSLAGVAILVGIGSKDLAGASVLGYVLCFSAIISWVVYCFLVERLSGVYDEAVILFYQAAAGALAMLPFVFVFPPASGALLIPSVLVNLVILGVFNSTIAYFLNLYAIKKIGVMLSNLFLDFMPVVTVAAGMLLNGVAPTVNQIVGGILVMVSVFMLNYDQAVQDRRAVENR